MVDMQVFYPTGRLLQDRLCRAAAVDKDERFFTGDKAGKRIDPPAGSGSITNRNFFSVAGAGTATSRRLPRPPESHASTSSGLPTVAESPIRCTGAAAIRSRRSSSILRCTPRSDSTNACNSSTITYRRCVRAATGPCSCSRTSSDSGVISKNCGASSGFHPRSPLGTSPCHLARESPVGRQNVAIRSSWSLMSAFKGER